MGTYIVRLAGVAGAVAGTVERPGEEQRTFADGEGLLRILAAWEEPAPGGGHPGYGSGSTSNSAMRDT